MNKRSLIGLVVFVIIASAAAAITYSRLKSSTPTGEYQKIAWLESDEPQSLTAPFDISTSKKSDEPKVRIRLGVYAHHPDVRPSSVGNPVLLFSIVKDGSEGETLVELLSVSTKKKGFQEVIEVTWEGDLEPGTYHIKAQNPQHGWDATVEQRK